MLTFCSEVFSMDRKRTASRAFSASTSSAMRAYFSMSASKADSGLLALS